MADAAAVQPSQPMVPRVRDQQFREIYSNSSITAVGPFDITITIQKTSEISPGQLGVTDQCTVTMSPQHFKAFVRSAAETLSAYERGFGALTISDADSAPIRSAEEIVGMINAARSAHAASTSSSPTEPPPPSKRSRGASPKKEKQP